MTRIEGLAELNGNLTKLRRLSRRQHITALRAGALVIQNGAKRRVPVLTGTLRRSITNAPLTGQTAVAVGTNVEYGPYVEYGTSRMAAQPYLRPAMDEDGQEAAQEIARAYERFIGEVL